MTNFFPPLYSFIYDQKFILLLIIVFLSIYIRSTKKTLSKERQKYAVLYQMYRTTNTVDNQRDALISLHREFCKILGTHVFFFLPNMQNKLSLIFPHKNELPLSYDKLSYEKLANASYQQKTVKRLQGKNGVLQALFQPFLNNRESGGVLACQVTSRTQRYPHFFHLFKVLTDHASGILERINLSEKIKETSMNVEKESLRSMLLSSVSHDLKTPLSSIICSLSLYRNLQQNHKLDSKRATELTTTALEEAERLKSFISNILNMTRIESGAIRFNLEWNDPIELLFRVRKRFLLLHDSDRLNIILGTPHYIKVDPTMIGQVLQNVLDNAFKYSPKKSKITIFSDFDRKKNGAFYLISDQGSGIPIDRIERIFDKFERLQREDSQVAGTGLGLAISAQIIHQHKGTIVARNRSNGGTEIAIWLPEAKLAV